MKTKAFQTKRRPKGGFRALHAKTRKRKQRVAAAASGGDFAVEEPNLGVARALVVILILHLAAIGAILVHHNTTKNDLAVKDSPSALPDRKSKAVAGAEQQAVAQIGPDDDYDWVGAGDTYERLAREHGVSADVLRRLNDNQPLQVGYAVRLPSKQAAAAQAAVAQASPEPMRRETLPPIVDVPARNGMPDEYEIMAEPQLVEAAAEPFLIEEPMQPAEPLEIRNVTAQLPPEPQPKAKPVVQEQPKPKPQPVTYKSYTVRKGDTIWAIANRNGVSQDRLLSANGNFDPRKMKIGMTLKIPN